MNVLARDRDPLHAGGDFSPRALGEPKNSQRRAAELGEGPGDREPLWAWLRAGVM